MNTSVGTRCSGGALVHDSQCLSPGCACPHAGVHCLSDTQLCLCDDRRMGTIMETANNTVCAEDRLEWATHRTCDADGFYCTSPCSVSYYYCTNGRRMPDQFVPAGTVCGGGALMSPGNCSYTPVHATCPTEAPSIQCMGQCSTSFYQCIRHTAYGVQAAPVGLVCYDNAFILGSDPLCAENAVYQTFPLFVDYSNESATVLYQYALTSAIAEAITHAGVPVTAADIYIGVAGRRLAVSEQLLSVQSSDTSLAGVIAHAMRELPTILERDNLAVRVWLPASTRTPSANAIAFPMSGANRASAGTVVLAFLAVLGYLLNV